MADPNTDDFRKAAQKHIDVWRADVAKTLAKVDLALNEIRALEQLKAPSPDEKKKLSLLTSHRDAMRKAVIDSSKTLESRLRALKPPDKAEPADLGKLDGWLGDSLRLGAVAFTKNVGIVPNKSILDKKSGAVRVPFSIKVRF